jgi:HK97 gp10 family phage protein
MPNRGGAKIVVTGDRELDRALKRLGPKVAGQLVRKACRKALAPVKARVAANVPKGPTGNLEQSVTIRAGGRSRSIVSIVVTIDLKSMHGPKYYAAFREFGAEGKEGAHFMERAFEETKDEAEKTAEQEIRQGILDEAAKQ